MTAEQPPSSARQAEARLALALLFEYTALPLTLQWKNAPATGRVQFEVSIPPAGDLVSAGNNSVDMDFLAVATARDGNVAAQSSKNFRATLNA